MRPVHAQAPSTQWTSQDPETQNTQAPGSWGPARIARPQTPCWPHLNPILPDFYKVLITKSVAEKLKLDLNLPLVELIEIKKNKSFVAEKAIGAIGNALFGGGQGGAGLAPYKKPPAMEGSGMKKGKKKR